jgi:hypothetical protein
MTSLSGEFQTDLPIHDAIVPCTEAISSLGWHIETVEANRVVAYTGSDPDDRAKIEIDLGKTDQGTDIRITGTDSDVNPLHRDDLIGELNKARDAVERFLEEAEEEQASEAGKQPSEEWRPEEEAPAEDEQEVDSTPQTPAGWYPDVYDESRERYWDGEEWTEEFRPVESASKPDAKPARGGRKEARAEKRRQSRERAEERRRLKEEDRRAKESAAPYDAGEDAPEQGQAPAASTPAKFRSLHTIAGIYGLLGWVVAILGPIGVIAAAAAADGSDRPVTLIGGLLAVAFQALVLFGIAAAIRLALAVEENTRTTAELLKADR